MGVTGEKSNYKEFGQGRVGGKSCGHPLNPCCKLFDDSFSLAFHKSLKLGGQEYHLQVVDTAGQVCQKAN